MHADVLDAYTRDCGPDLSKTAYCTLPECQLASLRRTLHRQYIKIAGNGTVHCKGQTDPFRRRLTVEIITFRKKIIPDYALTIAGNPEFPLINPLLGAMNTVTSDEPA